MNILPDVSLDFETRSVVDLKKAGVYPYAAHHHTGIWCLAYALPGDDEVKLWTPEQVWLGGDEDDELRELAADGLVTFRAHNAQFEYVIWNTIMHKRYGFPRIEIERWYCTAAECAALALPRALDNVARVLGVSEQKDMKGAGLMLRMAKPRNAAAMKKDPTLEPTWWDEPERLARLYEYNKQDVRTERAVAEKIRRLSPRERAVWLADARINERGVMIDRPLIDTMMRMGDAITKRTNAELRRITNGRVEGVTKPKDIVAWLNDLQFDDDEIASIAKDKIDLLLAKENLPDAAREVLGLRVEAGKSSVAKLQRMLQFACADDRMRGLLLYHGASTGRWSGKGPQVQNFPARSPWLSVDKDLVEHMLPFVRAGALDAIDICYPVLEVLALCLRACLRAAPGYRFIGGDFSQIEARVLAWLAGQMDLLTLFATGQDVYKPMAAAIYKVAVELVTKAQRDMGKRAILGCGYGMGWEKFIATSWKEARQVLDEAFAKRVIATYREKNDCIVALWHALDDAAISAVKQPGAVFYAADGKLAFTKRGDYLWIVLPSKRLLAYHKPEIRIERTPWGADKETVTFYGENQKRQWVRQKTYGGFWAENVTQAIARDLMAEAMLRAEDRGYPIVLTVHDELLAEVPEGFGSAKEFTDIMCFLPAWAEGLPVKAEVGEMQYYGK